MKGYDSTASATLADLRARLDDNDEAIRRAVDARHQADATYKRVRDEHRETMASLRLRRAEIVLAIKTASQQARGIRGPRSGAR